MYTLNVGERSLQLATTLSEPAALFSDEWLASEVWPAAVHLAEALVEHERLALVLRGARRVVELGSGTGAGGLAAWAAGAKKVLLTDVPASAELLCHNVELAQATGAVDVATLNWRCSWAEDKELACDADVVLAADCLNPVYGPAHAEALAATIEALLSRAAASDPAWGPDPRANPPCCILAQGRRGEQQAEAAFFAACRKRSLEWKRIGVERAIVNDVSHLGVAAADGDPVPVDLYKLTLATGKYRSYKHGRICPRSGSLLQPF